VGQGGMAQPPTPAIAGPTMDVQLSGNATRRTRETQQEGRENPVPPRLLALGQQRVGEVVEGAPTAVAPVALASWPVMVRAPRADVVGVTPGTLERAIFPPQRTDVGLALFGAEELVDR
jgi:hypothetical protein